MSLLWLRSLAYGRQGQVRDPAIVKEDGRLYRLRALAEASGIGLAQLFFDPNSPHAGGMACAVKGSLN